MLHFPFFNTQILLRLFFLNVLGSYKRGCGCVPSPGNYQLAWVECQTEQLNFSLSRCRRSRKTSCTDISNDVHVRRKSESDMSAITSSTPCLASPQTERYGFVLWWKFHRNHVVMLHSDSSEHKQQVSRLAAPLSPFSAPTNTKLQEHITKAMNDRLILDLHADADNAVRWWGKAMWNRQALKGETESPLLLCVNWQPLAWYTRCVRMSTSIAWHRLLLSAETRRSNSTEG